MEGRQVSHYEIVRLLGRGGMGEVWEAVDLHLDRRPVALKFLSADLARDGESLVRFEREASSAARLKHPHIATVHAFVREGPLPFIDMELLTGGSLRDRMGGAPMPLPTALAIARDVALGLAHAHRRGVIHRDIKPENLMFDDEGRVRVADFGLARATQASKLTMTGTTLGTAAYMSPEAIRGDAGAPADVFALGAVLYEMLAGRPPWVSDQPLSLMYAIAHEPAVPIPERRPDVPRPVADLLDQLLDKDPAKRPDAAEVARVLAGLTGSTPPRFEPVTEDHDAVRLSRRDTVKLGPLVPAARPRPSKARVAAGLLLALVLAVGAAIVLLNVVQQSGARARREAVALNNRGVELMGADSLSEAEQKFEEAVARDRDYLQPKINLADLLRRRGERDRAAQLLSAVLKQKPDSTLQASAHAGLADIELDASNFGGAIDHLRSAVALAPSNEVYANNLAFALIRGDRYTEAWQVLEPALARFPDRPALMKNAGIALVKLDREQEALPLLDRAIRQSPGYAPAWGVRALARAEAGDARGAQSDWAEYARRETDATALAEIRESLGRAGVDVAPTTPAMMPGLEKALRAMTSASLRSPPAPTPPTPGGLPAPPAAAGMPENRLELTGDLVIAAVLMHKNTPHPDSCIVLATDLEPAVLKLNLRVYRGIAKGQGRRLLITFRNHAGQPVEPAPESIRWAGRPLQKIAPVCRGAGTGYLIPLD